MCEQSRNPACRDESIVSLFFPLLQHISRSTPTYRALQNGKINTQTLYIYIYINIYIYIYIYIYRESASLFLPSLLSFV